MRIRRGNVFVRVLPTSIQSVSKKVIYRVLFMTRYIPSSSRSYCRHNRIKRMIEVL